MPSSAIFRATPRERVVADFERFFSADYTTARASFRELAQRAGFSLSAYPIGQRGPDGGELTIDVAIRGSAPAALVISSGLHGIEGYFGSAVQSAFLERGAQARADRRVVLIHALNPYGFAWRRRVNEDNVDLNRNFLLAGQPYDGVHESYRELEGLLNPLTVRTRPELPLGVAALGPLLRHGFRALKNAVAQGQYAYPRGLFFGGCAPSRTQAILREQLEGWVGESERVLHVDLHSGRGRWGSYALGVDAAPASERFLRLQRTFGQSAVEGFDPSGVLYEIRGALGPWLDQLLPRVQYDCLLAEFGTYNALSVLAALRDENRAHHYGQRAPQAVERAKRALFEAFCPRSPSWRRRVVTRALSVVDQALA